MKLNQFQTFTSEQLVNWFDVGNSPDYEAELFRRWLACRAIINQIHTKVRLLDYHIDQPRFSPAELHQRLEELTRLTALGE